MITLESIKQLGLPITWRLLSIAIYDGYLQREAAVDYAIEQLESGNEQMEVCELASTHPSEKDDICALLKRLVAQENTNHELEWRKLRAALVNEALKEKKENCVDGLVCLTELWIGLGCPSDSPHIIQGQNNSIEPKDYYSDQNYDLLYEKNTEWLKKELACLKESKCSF